MLLNLEIINTCIYKIVKYVKIYKINLNICHLDFINWNYTMFAGIILVARKKYTKS